MIHVSFPIVRGGPIEHIPQDWVKGLEEVGLLGLINIPHFGRLNEENAYVKQFLAYFHGGTLWLGTPVVIMVDLISNIMWLPKDGPSPSHYLKAWANDKRLAEILNKKYDLQHHGKAYRIDRIND